MNENSARDVNRILARQINDEARTNPSSPLVGKYVGIAAGKVVAVSDDLDEMIRRLHAVEPDPEKTTWLEAGVDYREIHHVWRST